MGIGVPTWVPADSKSALVTILGSDAIASGLVTEDPNSWGYLQLPNGKKLAIGYSDLGLRPAAISVGQTLFVGIDELLVGFYQDTLERIFTYRMPTVFHEFLSFSDPIVVRDEVGFVCLSVSGTERWRHLTNGPIEKFAMANGSLRGETIDGEKFSFSIPD
jgi:hypothetical protein